MDAENISTGNEWFLASPALLNKSDMKLSQGSFYFEEGRNSREEAQIGRNRESSQDTWSTIRSESPADGALLWLSSTHWERIKTKVVKKVEDDFFSPLVF